MTQQYKNIILTLIPTLIWTLNSIACSCEGEGTVSGSVKYSDVVLADKLFQGI